MKFRCSECDQEHVGAPAFGFSAPVQYLDVPEAEREKRVFLTSDTCVIDDQHFFVRGCLEIPVLATDEFFSWGVWVSLSEASFFQFQDLLDVAQRAHQGPFLGWLCSPPRPYPDSMNLKAKVHLRNDGMRPYIELEPTEHPLAVEQRHGITVERVARIYEIMVHGTQGA